PADRKKLEERIDGIEKTAGGIANLFPQTSDNFQVGVAEAMLFANNEALLKSLLEGAGNLTERMKQEPDLTKRTQLAVRPVLGRPAGRVDLPLRVGYVERRQGRPAEANQHLVWALLTSAEFRFNH